MLLNKGWLQTMLSRKAYFLLTIGYSKANSAVKGSVVIIFFKQFKSKNY